MGLFNSYWSCAALFSSAKKHLKLLLNLLFGSAVEISAMPVVGNNDGIPTILSLLNVVVSVIADHSDSPICKMMFDIIYAKEFLQHMINSGSEDFF